MARRSTASIQTLDAGGIDDISVDYLALAGVDVEQLDAANQENARDTLAGYVVPEAPTVGLSDRDIFNQSWDATMLGVLTAHREDKPSIAPQALLQQPREAAYSSHALLNLSWDTAGLTLL